MKRANVAALIAPVLLAACATVELNLPAITPAPTGQHDTGRIVWRDLLTTTPEESQAFYRELFGWQFERPGIDLGFGGPGSYLLIRHEGRIIGGMFDATTLRREVNVSQWITMMSVADIDAAVRRVTTAGGEVLASPADVGERGTLALVAGPDGALLGLVESRDGDPPPVEPAHDEWLWDELWTDDVEGSATFLAEVAGLDVESGPARAPDSSYRILQSGGRPKAGLMAMPFEGEHPVWVNYIRVEDPAAITASVDRLGGRVIIEAQERAVGGRAAMIAGPSGAGVALQTWPLD